jgi:hypothetical protein
MADLPELPELPELDDLQRRFYAIATGRAPIEEAAGMLSSRPSRIDIYRRMYIDRLVDVLADDHAKLSALLDERWRELAEAYLRACPPAHPDVREVGRRLGEFLARSGPIWQADLARLEWARSDVFFGADATPLARERLAALDPAEFPSVWLRLVPAHAIVSLASNADDLWSAVEDSLPAPTPTACTRTVVVWRRGSMTVVHRTLDPDEVRCIELVARGARFSAICEALVDAADPAARAIELLVRWIDAELLADL